MLSNSLVENRFCFAMLGVLKCCVVVGVIVEEFSALQWILADRLSSFE
jgi:hypothetical protein